MSEKKRNFGGRGYYIALVLCAAAIGIMSYVYNAGQEEPSVQTANIPASVTDAASLPTIPRESGETQAATKPTAGKLPVCAPVQGEEIIIYSNSIVPTGFGVRSISTRLMPFTSLVILFVIL